MNEKKTQRIKALHGALVFPVIVQVVFMVLAGMILDGGHCARIVMVAIAGHWLLVLWIVLRRRNALTKTDTILIKAGFFLWLLIVVVLMTVIRAVAGAMCTAQRQRSRPGYSNILQNVRMLFYLVLPAFATKFCFWIATGNFQKY